MTPLELVVDKLLSKKLWVIVAFGALNALNDQLGLNLDIQNLTYGVMAYFGAQGAADTVKEYLT